MSEMSNGHGHNSRTPMSVRLAKAGGRAYGAPWAFLATFAVVFIGFVVLLAYLDLLPEAAGADAAEAPLRASPLVVSWEPGERADAVLTDGEGELPVKIEIPSIGLTVAVANPTSTDVEVLDKYLLSGAVRYPTSGRVGADGNAIIFGHSSYLPIVNNKNYKAFNDIQKLKTGALVTVYGKEKAYTYRVETVAKADADSAAIPLSVDGAKLTLATCNSFGEKSDRFIVTASLVESRVI